MLQDLVGKKVNITINWYSSAEGELIEVDETWVKLKLKNKTTLVNIKSIVSISANDK